jgi:hypothetical protein
LDKNVYKFLKDFSRDQSAKYQDGRWFSPGTPASSTTKTGRHDIAEILLKVALKHQKSNKQKSNVLYNSWYFAD